MGNIGSMMAKVGQFSVMHGESMLKDVTPNMFGVLPTMNGQIVKCNHPAWVYGHLAMYSSSMLELMGLPVGISARPEGWYELFKNGTACTHDPSGTIYPAMGLVSGHYLSGYKLVLGALPDVSDDTLLKPNPMGGRMTELLPTVGAAVNFLISGHPMNHLGQISTWRRCMGLPSAM